MLFSIRSRLLQFFFYISLTPDVLRAPLFCVLQIFIRFFAGLYDALTHAGGWFFVVYVAVGRHLREQVDCGIEIRGQNER